MENACHAGSAHLEKATLVVLGLERMGLMHSDQKTRFSVKGEPVYDYCAVSSFSEYTVVHSGCAVKLSPLAPLEKICLLSCGVAAGKCFSCLLLVLKLGNRLMEFQ